MAKGINHLATADGLFFGKGALDLRKTGKVVDEALKGCDDGELFLEYVQSESLAFDDGKLSLPASIAGHRSARAALTMARTSSGVRVRKVTPI